MHHAIRRKQGANLFELDALVVTDGRGNARRERSSTRTIFCEHVLATDHRDTGKVCLGRPVLLLLRLLRVPTPSSELPHGAICFSAELSEILC